jgi:hypothetical protein
VPPPLVDGAGWLVCDATVPPAEIARWYCRGRSKPQSSRGAGILRDAAPKRRRGITIAVDGGDVSVCSGAVSPVLVTRAPEGQC